MKMLKVTLVTILLLSNIPILAQIEDGDLGRITIIGYQQSFSCPTPQFYVSYYFPWGGDGSFSQNDNCKCLQYNSNYYTKKIDFNKYGNGFGSLNSSCSAITALNNEITNTLKAKKRFLKTVTQTFTCGWNSTSEITFQVEAYPNLEPIANLGQFIDNKKVVYKFNVSLDANYIKWQYRKSTNGGWSNWTDCTVYQGSGNTILFGELTTGLTPDELINNDFEIRYITIGDCSNQGRVGKSYMFTFKKYEVQLPNGYEEKQPCDSEIGTVKWDTTINNYYTAYIDGIGGPEITSGSELKPDSYKICFFDNRVDDGWQIGKEVQFTLNPALRLFSSFTPIKCPNAKGSITVKPTGGTGKLTASIYKNGNRLGVEENIEANNGKTYADLDYGSYVIEVRDEKKCTKNTETINLTNIPTITTDKIEQFGICYGDPSKVGVTIKGGTNPYSYRWADESNYTSLASVQNEVSRNINLNEHPNGIDLIITDNNNCPVSPVTFKSDITLPLAFNLSTLPVTYKQTGDISSGEITLKKCDVGNYSITLGATGGLRNYKIINKVDNSTREFDDGSNISYSLDPEKTPYTFELTDSKGCSITLKVNLIKSLSILTPIVEKQPCGTTLGTVNVSANGGDGIYRYYLDNSLLSSSLFNATGGVHIVKVKDENGNGCETTTNVTLQYPVSFSATSTMDCSKDKSDISVAGLTGGNISYTYSLTGSEQRNGSFSEGNGIISNLSSGTYDLKVTSDGCEHTASSIAVYNRPVIKVFEPINPSCQDEKARVDYEVVEGKSPELSYALTSQNTLLASGTLTNLKGSINDLTVSGKIKLSVNECSITSEEKDVIIPQFSIKGITYAPWNCSTLNGKPANGVITAAVNSTFTNYKVLLIRMTGEVETSDIVEQSSAENKTEYSFIVTTGGKFKVRVVSDKSCSTETLTSDYFPQSYLNIKTVTPVDPVCYGNEGTVKVEVENLGGRALNVEGTADIAGNCATFRSPAGTRTYKVNDGFCYLETAPKTLTDPTKLSFKFTIDNPPCNGDKAKVNFTEIAPAGAYTYHVDNQSFDTPSFSIPVTGLTTNVTLKVVEMNEKKCESDGQQFTISMPAKLETKFTTDPVKCNGEKNGVIHLDAIGGTKPYSFTDGATPITETIYSGLKAGSYTLNVTDQNSCNAKTTVEVAEPQLLSFVSAPNLPTCRNGNDGSIVLTINGGNIGNYEYKLGSGAFTQLVDSKIDGLNSNKYDVTIKDAKGCLATNAGISVGNQPEWIWDITAVDPTCSNNGEIKINSIANGYNDYKYYENKQIGASILTSKTGLMEGTYPIAIIDSKSCIQSTNVILSKNEMNVSFIQTNVTCYKGSDGKIEVKISGGRKNKHGAYACKLMKGTLEITSNVSISNDNQTITYSKLYADDYTLFVSDASGCRKTITIPLTQFGKAIDFAVTPFEANTCQEKGRIEVSNVVGFQGLKSDLVYSAGNLVQKDNSTFSVNTGPYSVTVTDSKGCHTTKGTVLTPEQLSAKFENIAMDCSGNNNGSVKITQLQGGIGQLSTSCRLTSEPEPLDNEYKPQMYYGGLKPGKYIIYGRDENNRCKMSVGEFEIKDVEPLQLTYGYNSPTCNGFTDGVVNIQVTGGNGAYALNAFGKEIPIAEENGKIGGFAKIEGIKADTYPITLTDKKSCPNKGTDKIVVNEPEPITLKLEKTDDVDCKNYGNGRIYLTAQGGNGGYVFATTKDGSAFKNDANQPSSYLLDKLTPATYAFDIKDSKGCLLSKSIAPVAIKEPDLLTLAADSYSNLTCFKNATGSITVKPSGGNIGAMLYSMNGIEQNSPTFSALPAATHTVTVKDSKGCTANVEQNLTEPTLLEVASLNEVNPLCFENNGSISPVLKGGTAPYYTKVDGYGDYAAPAKVSLPDGSYNLWYKDKNGCEFSLPFRLVQPKKLEINETIKAPLCTGFDGKVTLAATGGTPEYKYRLGTAEYNSANEFTIKRGTFNFSVKDAHGCVADKQIEVSEPTPLTLASEFANPLCNGLYGTITLSAGGGTLPYYYTNSFTGTFPTSGLLEGGNNQKVTFTGLQPNVQFTPAVKDANGCLMAIAPITLIQPDALSWKPDVITNLRCANDASGAVKVEVAGGTSPYTYRLNDAENTTGLFSGLGGGMFNTKVADKNGCELQKSISVFEPTPLSVVTSLDPQRCFSLCDGKITAYPSGGTLPYTISWNNPAFGGSNMLANLCGGSYILNVKDGNGCEFNRDLSFATPEQILINVGFKDTTLCKGQTIKVTPEPQKWGLMWMRDGKFLSNGSSYTVTSPGSYIAKAIDAKGCTVDFGFGVTYVNDEMNSDFLISSKVAAADTVAIVDISYPKPAKVEWKYDKNARAISQNDSYLYVVFDEPGTYSLGMVAYTGSCATSVEKRIEVGPKKDKYDIEKSLGYKESILKSFKLYPNPTSGEFKVKVLLNKAADIRLQISAVSNGTVLDTKELRGTDTYEVDFNKQELKQGFYIVNLTVEGQTFNLKMVKI